MKRTLILASCVACGGGESPTPPCPVDLPAGPIFVHAIGNSVVVFHDLAGSVLSSVETDVSGEAVGTVSACGAVTVVEDRSHLFTVTQVQPGENVDLRAVTAPTGGTARQITIDFPTVAGATSYEFRPGGARDGCSCPATVTSTSPTVMIVEACCVALDSTTAITAIASGPSTFTYASLERVSVPELSPNRASIAAWTTETATIQLSVADIPAASWTALMEVTQFSGAIAMDSVAVTQVDAPGVVVLPRLGDHVVTSAELDDPDTGARYFVSRSDPAPLPPSFALPLADFAPQVTSVTAYVADPARPIINWTTSRPTTDETAIAVGLALFDGSWTIVAPPDQPGGIRYPDLPEEVRQTMEVTAASVDIIFTATMPAYADAHRQPRALLLSRPAGFYPALATGVLHRLSRSGPFAP